MTNSSSKMMFRCFILFTSLELALRLCFLLPGVEVEAMTNPSSPSQRITSRHGNKLLIIGLGRVGMQVADLAKEKEDIQVFGTVRQSLTRGGNMANYNGNEIVRVPFDPVAVRENLFGCEDDQRIAKCSNKATSHVLFTIPLSREVDPLMEAVLKELREWWETEEDGNDSATKKMSDKHCHSKVLGILSTTGVYGNHDGKVVTENSQLLCEETSNAELYRRFEEDWISMSVGSVVKDGDEMVRNYGDSSRKRRLRIFRCAGIYDSSRSALHTVYKNLESATPASPSRSLKSSIPTTGNKTNRIHCIDLARGVLSGMFEGANYKDSKLEYSGVRIYNLADNLPESRSIVLSYAQELLASIGIDQYAFKDENETSEMTKITKPPGKSDVIVSSRSSITRQKRRERESKLVCNRRMREELFPCDGLLFPTYREGLDAIFNDPITPWQQRQL